MPDRSILELLWKNIHVHSVQSKITTTHNINGKIYTYFREGDSNRVICTVYDPILDLYDPTFLLGNIVFKNMFAPNYMN